MHWIWALVACAMIAAGLAWEGPSRAAVGRPPELSALR